MKLGWDLTTGLDRHLTTWRSPGDPSPGDYTFGFDLRGVPEGFIRRDGTAPVYRNGPWNGLQFSGEPEIEPNNSNFQFEFVAVANAVPVQVRHQQQRMGCSSSATAAAACHDLC